MNKTITKSFLFLLGLVLTLASCEKSDESLNLVSESGSSFLDIENEGYKVTLNAQAVPEGQKGTWRIYMGENGTFDDVNIANTVFHGEPGENYLLGWEVSSGDEYKASTISVSFKEMIPELDMYVSDTIADNISLYLNAIAPKYGAAGIWEIMEGEDGRITNADNANAEFIGTENKSYTLRWSLTYGSKTESLDFTFQSDTLRANAGIDRLDIITSKNESKFTNLNAFLPAGATANWELVSGHSGKVYTYEDPNSIMGGVADSVYTILWKVKVDEYESTDTLKVRFRGKWGVFTDDRDGKTYRFIEINGKRWMADNLDYNAPFTEYGRSWYYGQSSRAQIDGGHPVESAEERKLYGRLYNWFAATESAPEGWRLPMKEDFKDLETYLGGEFHSYEKMIVGGETGLEINFSGYSGYSNNSVVNRDYYTGQDQFGAFWTNNTNFNRWESQVKIYYKDSFSSGAAPFSMYSSGASVRYIQDIE